MRFLCLIGSAGRFGVQLLAAVTLASYLVRRNDGLTIFGSLQLSFAVFTLPPRTNTLILLLRVCT